MIFAETYASSVIIIPAQEVEMSNKDPDLNKPIEDPKAPAKLNTTVEIL